jgi:CheY-like chemotaxis protein
MIERVLLVAWKGSVATSWVETLQSGGYTVLLEDTTGERAWRTAKERGIDAVIIDGQKKPSHGRQTGHALRDTAKTRDIPIIWTNLDQEDSASVQAEVKPDVTLIAPTDATTALAALQTLHGMVRVTADAVDLTSNGVAVPPAPAPLATSNQAEAPANHAKPARRVKTLRKATADRKAKVAPKPAKKPAAKKKPVKKGSAQGKRR